MKCTLLAPAKLNLFLDITGRRSDGYHLVNMVMQSVSLYDEVTLITDEDGEEIKIECSDRLVPCDETNTAYKAVKLFFEHAGIAPVGITVRIKKNIPSQAGMAGGSTDAAAVLIGLNELFRTGLSKHELAEIGEKIGADVPFCVYGGTMTAEGIGTILTPLPDMPDCSFAVVKPDINISTAEAYRKSDEVGYDFLKNPDRVVNGICSGDIGEIAKGLYNKFEAVVNIPEIKEIKSAMIRAGALGACLTGSGSAIFGIFEKDVPDIDIDLEPYILHPVSGVIFDD